MTQFLKSFREEQDEEFEKMARDKYYGAMFECYDFEKMMEEITSYIHSREEALLKRIGENVLGDFAAADGFVGFTDAEWQGVKKFIPYLKQILQ